MARWKMTGSLEGNLATFDLKANRAMIAAANYVAPQAETYMRSNAPWTDRTGNARSGLSAQVVVNPNLVAIVLYHRMPYGVYLETRWSGRYQIIRPTMQVFAPKAIEAVGRVLFA